MKRDVKKRFRIKPFKNPSGATVWRVDGLLNGHRIRRNFNDRQKAVNESDRLEIEAQAADAALCQRMTRLSAPQLQAAELLFDRAGGDVEKVLGLLPLIRAVERKPVKQAAIAWLSAMEMSGKREVTVSVNRYIADAFLRVCAAEFCDEISQAETEAFIFNPENRTSQADRRKRLAQFMGFCISKGWMARNFAAELPKIKVERDLPAILSPEQVKVLLEKARTVRIDPKKVRGLQASKASRAAAGSMELYVLLTAFTGLRPAEARKIGKEAFHLDADPACIEIGAKMAKVSQCRQVELLPEIRDQISAVVRKVGNHARPHFNERLWKKVRKEAGVLDLWKNDILRHTYASWHYAIFKDIRRLAYTMGNSPEVLFQNYIRPMTAEDSKKYIKLIS